MRIVSDWLVNARGVGLGDVEIDAVGVGELVGEALGEADGSGLADISGVGEGVGV